MDPRTRFCHNPDCPARGNAGSATSASIAARSGATAAPPAVRTFAETRDTPLYRLKKTAELVTIVLTLLCHGCPLQAIVAAFGLDERTVADWRDRAGRHGQRFHEHHVLSGQVELGTSRPTSCTSRRSPAGLDGHGDGRPVAALARRGDQPETRPGPDHGGGADGPLLGPEPGDPGLRRWPGQLRDRLHAGLLATRSVPAAEAGRGWSPRPGCSWAR